MSLSISPVRDEQDNIVAAAKIARDIRENKKIERTLRTTEKLASAERLAAAHESNNPLETVTNLVFHINRKASTSTIMFVRGMCSVAEYDSKARSSAFSFCRLWDFRMK